MAGKRQRTTLTTIVDTYVASVPRDDDPTGFFAAKGSDMGTDAVLVVKEERLHVHGGYLSSLSPVLQAVLGEHYKGVKQPEISEGHNSRKSR